MYSGGYRGYGSGYDGGSGSGAGRKQKFAKQGSFVSDGGGRKPKLARQGSLVSNGGPVIKRSGSRFYGKTWWSDRFLNAFEGIDFANRLPRGVTYSRNGSCSGIRIEKGGHVKAEVQGSDRYPYKVALQFEDLSKYESKIQEVVQKKGQLVLSKILNGELPEFLDEDLKNIGIALFPSQWNEVKATCSCPDSAVPCKHLAAVIYLVSANIDKDPFTVFEIHNFDLRSCLGAVVASTAGSLSGEAASSSAAVASSSSQDASKSSGGTRVRVNALPVLVDIFDTPAMDDGVRDDGAVGSVAELARSLNLPAIPDLETQICDSMLRKQPLFFRKNEKDDFREVLRIFYKHWKKLETLCCMSPPSSSPPKPLLKAVKTLERVQPVLDARGSCHRIDYEFHGPLVGGSRENLFGEDSASACGGVSASACDSVSDGFSDGLSEALDGPTTREFVSHAQAAAQEGQMLLETEQNAIHEWSLCDIVELLEKEILPSDLSQYCYDLQYLKCVVDYVLVLVHRAAAVPQLLKTRSVSGPSKNHVRWVPAMFCPEVAAAHAKLAKALPRNLIRYGISHDRGATGERQLIPNSETALSYLVAEIVEKILPHGDPTKFDQLEGFSSDDPRLPKPLRKYIGSPVLSLFFGTSRGGTDHFTDPKNPKHFELKAVPQSIHVWLSRLFLAATEKNRLRVLVKRYPKDPDHFALAVEVERRARAKSAGSKNELSSTSACQLTQKPVCHPLQTFLKLKSVSEDEKLDVIAMVEVLNENIPGFEQLHLEFASRGSDSQEQQPGEEGASAADSSHDVQTFHYSEFGEVLMKAVPALESLGVHVVLPRSLRNRAVRPRLRLSVSSSADKTKKTSGVASLTTDAIFDWKIALGDKELTLEEFQAMVKKQKGMVKYLDQFILLDPNEATALAKLLAKEISAKTLSNHEKLRLMLGAGLVGRDDVQVHVDAKLRELMRKKLALSSGGNQPLYARPMIESCLKEIVDLLEGNIVPELLRYPCLHDSQTFDVQELDGTRRTEREAVVCKMHVKHFGREQPLQIEFALDSTFKGLTGAQRDKESWVPNAMTRVPMSPGNPPMMNLPVQRIVDAVEPLIQACSSRSSVSREIPASAWAGFSDEELSLAFHQVRDATANEIPKEQAGVKYGELKEVVDIARADPDIQPLSESGDTGGKEKETMEETEVPANLQAILREYQVRGFRWLAHNCAQGLGCVLADDMGLGKTIQVIALILHLKGQADGSGVEPPALKRRKTKDSSSFAEKAAACPVLVICPKSLLENWAAELQKFAPSLRVSKFHGFTAKQSVDLTADVVLTSPALTRSAANLEKLRRGGQNDKLWHLLVLDEAQCIKNTGSAQAAGVKGIKALNYIAMSGTPVENQLLEYYSIFDFVMKGYLAKNASEFQREFGKPIEKDRDKAKLEKFLRMTGPFLLRRLKTDKTVIKDLPAKVYTDHKVSLSKEQAALYQNVVDMSLKTVQESDGSSMQRRGYVLKMITNLKQVVDHPELYLQVAAGKPGRRASARASPQTVATAQPLASIGVVTPEDDGAAAAPLAAVPPVTDRDGYRVTAGNVAEEAARSGKTEALFEILTEVIASDEKALIFTQYASMGFLLAQLLSEKFLQAVPFFHGGLSMKARSDMVAGFQSPKSRTAFLILSLKAGGIGLNLTAATHVVHYDHWWNPAVEDQATDRAYRIGQTKKVFVHRLLSSGTMEEKVFEMMSRKRDLQNLTVKNAESSITDMTAHQLEALVMLDLNGPP